MITLDQVTDAADRLTASGHRASVRAVRRALGGGSPNVLAAHLRQWRRDRLVVPTAEAPASMVEEIAGVAPRLWSTALAEAKKHVQADLKRGAAAAAESQAAADELQSLLEEATVQIDQLRADRQRDADAARIDRASLADQVGHLQGAIANRDLEVQHLGTLVREAQKALTTQQEQNDRLSSMLALVEQERSMDQGQHRRELSAREQSIGEVTKRVNELQDKLTNAEAAAARSQQEAMGLADNLAESRRAIKETEEIYAAQLSSAHVEALSITQQLSKREEQIQNLSSEIRREEKRNEALEIQLVALQDASALTNSSNASLSKIEERLEHLIKKLDTRPGE